MLAVWIASDHFEMKKRSAHGPKKHWRDLVSIDLQNLNLSDSFAYKLDKES